MFSARLHHERLEEEEYYDTVILLANLGIVKLMRGQLQEAEEMNKRAL